MVRVGIVLLTVMSGFMTGALLAVDEGLSTIIPGVATLIGLAALIWKLVTDRRADQQMDGRYDDLIAHYKNEVAIKDARIAVLEAALAKCQGGT